MSKPFRSWNFLPWKEMFLTALLVVLGVMLLDFGLQLGGQFRPVAIVVNQLLAPPVGVITHFAIALGIGMVAVAILERTFARLNSNILWALLLCLAIGFLVRRWLPPPAILFQIESSEQVFGTIIGVFVKGKPYWRW